MSPRCPSRRARSLWRRALRAAGLLLLLVTLAACPTNPITGRKTFQVIPDATMRDMGLQAYQQQLSESEVSADPEAQALVERVGRRIAKVVDAQLEADGREPYDWEFTVIESEQVNAWALPGGKVAFYTGILPICQDEAGVAVVMGHEVAHAYARHANSRMSRGLLQQYGLGAIQQALGGSGDSQLQDLAMGALGVGVQVGMLAYSRADESEADQMGLTFMARAGYDPREAKAFWQRMHERAGGASPPEFLSTHPSHPTRIEDIEGWLPEALETYRKSGGAGS